MTAGIIISRAREEMKLPLLNLTDLFKISLVFLWQIETRLWRLFFFGSTLRERVFHCTPV